MKKVILGFLVLLLTSFSDKKKIPDTPANKFKVEGKIVTVYTTADKTDLKLASTGTLQFTDFTQPGSNECKRR